MDEAPGSWLTCARCGETKRAVGNFRRSGQAKSGYVSVCNACRFGVQYTMTELTCDVCGETKPVAEFERNAQTATGYRSLCRICMDLPFDEPDEREPPPGEAVLSFMEEWLPDGQVIYALVDPRNEAVRYAGRTADPVARYQRHLYNRPGRDRRILPFYDPPGPPDRTDGIGARAKAAWIAELRALGLRPEMRILEEVDPPYRAPERERRWTFHFVHLGAPLLNGDWPNIGMAEPFRRAIRDTPLNYLEEPLTSRAWLPLYRVMREVERASAKQAEIDRAERDAWELQREAARRMCGAADDGTRRRIAEALRWDAYEVANRERLRKRDAKLATYPPLPGETL